MNRATAASGLSRWIARICLLLIAVVPAAGCSSRQNINAAKSEVSHFREQLADHKFAELYAETSNALKKSTTEEQFVQLLAAIDRKLGAVKNAEENGWKIDYNTSGTTVTLDFKTSFERGDATESFVYRIEGGKPLLVGYHINSNAMLVN
jgi:opacity protein-like surface antigen